MDISGKVFVVTGAGNGIGREVSLELLRRGASVAGVDLKKNWLEETASLAGSNASRFAAFPLDITDRAAIGALPKKVEKALGSADSIVNVAGIIQPFVRVNDVPFEAIDRVLSINLGGPINLIKVFLPGLLTKSQANITNVSSMGSYAPVPGQTIYGASKAAINLLSEGLRSELMGSNVHVTVIYPGAIGTNIAQNSGLKMEAAEGSTRKVVKPADAGLMIVDAIAGDKKRILIGQDATFMWRINRLSPDTAAGMIYKGMKDLLK